MKKFIAGLVMVASLGVASVALAAPAPAKCTIKATPSTVKMGQTTTLKWSSTGATRAQLGLSPVPVSGTKVVRPIVGPWSYSLFVFGKGGIGECSVMVKVK